MSKRSFLVLLICTSAAACGDPEAKPLASAQRSATASASGLVASAPAPSASTPAAPASSPAAPSASVALDPNAPFKRNPPHSQNSDADGIDQCLQEGGSYFSCGGALYEEKDPVMKRYLWRITQGHVAGLSGYKSKGPKVEDFAPHAEVPAMCDPTKPCGTKNEMGELNGAGPCLARAYVSYLAHNEADAKASHAHACKCDAKQGNYPGYNRTQFICDAEGKPAFVAPDMKPEEGKEIIDCAACHPKRGLDACKKEIERLKTTDAELSTFIATKQLKRCQTPNEGYGDWAQWP